MESHELFTRAVGEGKGNLSNIFATEGGRVLQQTRLPLIGEGSSADSKC